VKVEIQIATGDPQSPQGWTVTPTVFLITFPFEARWRISWLFNLLGHLDNDIGPDKILVMMVDASLTAALTARVRELRDRTMPGRLVCLLDNGLTLSGLTPNQIRARVG
jgi:hypothetical protein